VGKFDFVCLHKEHNFFSLLVLYRFLKRPVFLSTLALVAIVFYKFHTRQSAC